MVVTSTYFTKSQLFLVSLLISVHYQGHFAPYLAVTIVPNRVLFKSCLKKIIKFIFVIFSLPLFFLRFLKPLEKLHPCFHVLEYTRGAELG